MGLDLVSTLHIISVHLTNYVQLPSIMGLSCWQTGTLRVDSETGNTGPIGAGIELSPVSAACSGHVERFADLRATGNQD